ncbi:hypothetical protein [Gilliamella sp. App2-1]|uniref:hypothetical protein n=1 Tax=Gilliamella sp. App2-1 TaxID=3120230 RepID=UPI0009E2CC5D|nr:hypothetical protein [Gilliamella apicola]
MTTVKKGEQIAFFIMYKKHTYYDIAFNTNSINSRDKKTLFCVATRLNCQIGSQEEAIKFGDIIFSLPFPLSIIHNYLQSYSVAK